MDGQNVALTIWEAETKDNFGNITLVGCSMYLGAKFPNFARVICSFQLQYNNPHSVGVKYL